MTLLKSMYPPDTTMNLVSMKYHWLISHTNNESMRPGILYMYRLICILQFVRPICQLICNGRSLEATLSFWLQAFFLC